MSKLLAGLAVFCLSVSSWAAPPDKTQSPTILVGSSLFTCPSAMVAAAELPTPPEGQALVIHRYKHSVNSSYQPIALDLLTWSGNDGLTAYDLSAHVGFYQEDGVNSATAQEENVRIPLVPLPNQALRVSVRFNNTNACTGGMIYPGFLVFTYSFEPVSIGSKYPVG